MLSFKKHMTLITFITLCAAFFASSIQANDTLMNTTALQASINAELNLKMEELKQQLTQDMDTILIAEEQESDTTTQ
ncbi:hypothetical protein [uncultured Shewanella sp.]|uniref:hypothetical protein n=1 Tax=uncultured Shewanella sp. TaxID=173975 RepID=UPI0026023AC5|nr:hypothetical protein [uncultured Shewanella sp.]